jgi:hypothetical protein
MNNVCGIKFRTVISLIEGTIGHNKLRRVQRKQ